MRARKSLLAVFFGSILFARAGTAGCAEREKTIDSILEKWEQASQNRKTFDAKITRSEYDYNLSRQEHVREVCHGRFYFEAPEQGRYEMRRADDANDGPAPVQEIVVWQSERLLWIEPLAKRYTEIPATFFSELRARSRELQNASAWQRFAGMFVIAFANLSQPEGLLPFVVNIDAKDLRQRFDLSYEEHDGNIWLTADVKKGTHGVLFDHARVILDPDTYMAQAIETSFDGSRRVVYLLTEIKANETPKDRDQLMSPDLTGLENHSPAVK